MNIVHLLGGLTAVVIISGCGADAPTEGVDQKSLNADHEMVRQEAELPGIGSIATTVPSGAWKIEVSDGRVIDQKEELLINLASSEDSGIEISGWVARYDVMHPDGWADSLAPGGGSAEVPLGEPGFLSAEEKRGGFEQLVRAARGDKNEIKGMEWFGYAGYLEANHGKMPAFATWMSSHEVPFEVITPKTLTNTSGGFSGVEMITIVGESFAPYFTIYLVDPKTMVVVGLTLPINDVESLVDHPGFADPESHGESNYALLRSGFAGDQYADVRHRMNLLRELAGSMVITSDDGGE